MRQEQKHSTKCIDISRKQNSERHKSNRRGEQRTAKVTDLFVQNVLLSPDTATAKLALPRRWMNVHWWSLAFGSGGRGGDVLEILQIRPLWWRWWRKQMPSLSAPALSWPLSAEWLQILVTIAWLSVQVSGRKWSPHQSLCGLCVFWWWWWWMQGNDWRVRSMAEESRLSKQSKVKSEKKNV